jgi:hypothetical protein
MATEMNSSPHMERIDWQLEEVARAWVHVPDDAAEWDTWDEESQMVYRLHWTTPREQWADLERWEAEGWLTPDQQHRFGAIETLMRVHQATLARMLHTSGPMGPTIASIAPTADR